MKLAAVGGFQEAPGPVALTSVGTPGELVRLRLRKADSLSFVAPTCIFACSPHCLATSFLCTEPCPEIMMYGASCTFLCYCLSLTPYTPVERQTRPT